MSRDWRLYLDDLIASAEKIGRLTGPHDFATFNLQVIGESAKRLPDDVRARLPSMQGSGPARLRDLIGGS